MVNGETTIHTSGVLQDRRTKSIWLDGRTKAENSSNRTIETREQARGGIKGSNISVRGI